MTLPLRNDILNPPPSTISLYLMNGGAGGGGIGRHMEWPNICRQFSLLYKGIVALIKLNFILK